MSQALFDWTNKKAWFADVSEYAGEFLTSEIQQQIYKRRPLCWSDDFRWLPIEAPVQRFAESFSKYYQHIRAFHGCRPTDLKSYYELGLQGQNAERIEAQFKSIFSDVEEKYLIEAISAHQHRTDSEKDRFWVLVNEEYLIKRCGHYLIQGSEYLMSLAAILCSIAPYEDYRMRLRNVGIPTILEMHLPTSSLSSGTVTSLAKIVLSAWGEKLARRRMGGNEGVSFSVQETMAPKYIVGHTHPAKIVDPHFQNSVYVNEQTKFVYCTTKI